MKVLKIVAGSDTLEIAYNQQDEPRIAEAQIEINADPIEGTMTVFIDEVDDIDAIIDFLSEIKSKMISHYAEKQNHEFTI